jgi:hypothetical protein
MGAAFTTNDFLSSLYWIPTHENSAGNIPVIFASFVWVSISVYQCQWEHNWKKDKIHTFWKGFRTNGDSLLLGSEWWFEQAWEISETFDQIQEQYRGIESDEMDADASKANFSGFLR